MKVILALPTSINTKAQNNETPKEGNSPSITSETEGDSAGSTNLSDEETETLLETAACIMGEANNISCVGLDGSSFLIEAATVNSVFADSKKKA